MHNLNPFDFICINLNSLIAYDKPKQVDRSNPKSAFCRIKPQLVFFSIFQRVFSMSQQDSLLLLTWQSYHRRILLFLDASCYEKKPSEHTNMLIPYSSN